MTLSTLFWDVDTQHDFIDPDGNLSVPGASRIVDNLRALTDFAVANSIPISGSVDSHEEDDDEFEQFPPHCVAGTPGQRKIAATTPERSELVQTAALDRQLPALYRGEVQQLIIEKQELDVFSEPVADRILTELAPEEIVVYGVATEYCVLLSVRGMCERGLPVTVVENAIAAVDDEQGEKAIADMRENGAKFTTTESVVAAI